MWNDPVADTLVIASDLNLRNAQVSVDQPVGMGDADSEDAEARPIDRSEVARPSALGL